MRNPCKPKTGATTPCHGTTIGSPTSPVAERRRRAMKKMDALRKKGVDIQPMSRSTAARSPRPSGGSLVRPPGIVQRLRKSPAARPHLRPQRLGLPLGDRQGSDRSQGQRLRTVHRPGRRSRHCRPRNGTAIKRRCSGQIGSLLELLQGRLSRSCDGAWSPINRKGCFRFLARFRLGAIAPIGP